MEEPFRIVLLNGEVFSAKKYSIIDHFCNLWQSLFYLNNIS